MVAIPAGEPRTELPLPRRGGPNRLLGPGGKPLLVIVSGTDIDAMVDAGLVAIGGIGRIFGANREVLLKPNTNQRDPFPSITAPETIRVVARHCRAAGAERIIVHEDHKREESLYYDPDELRGMDLCWSHGPTSDDYVLVEYDGWSGDAESAPNSGAEARWDQRLGALPLQPGPRLRVAREIQEAAVVINLPVLKRHFAGQITSALKNHFGSVFATHRWRAHASMASNRDYYDRKLVEFASAVRPELTITDVRSLQAVTGPSRDEHTRIIDGVNRLIISGDMVAADAVALELMKQHDATFTPAHEAIVRRQHQIAEELGLGTGNLANVEILEVDAR